MIDPRFTSDGRLHPRRPPRDSEFYVGYLPVPRGIRRLLLVAVPLLLAATTATIAVVARLHNDPGDAVWADGQAKSFVGVIDCKPYPMLRVAAENPRYQTDTLLLVEVGKHGGGQRARPFDGKCVKVTGYVLQRDGRRMLELLEGDEAFQEVGEAEVPGLDRIRQHVVPLLERDATMSGEIIDSKCYLGAMKPGDGKAHKECATLCIAGGIPPMFVVRSRSGAITYYLLTDEKGDPIDERFLPFVADNISAIGDVERRDQLLLFKVYLHSIKRL